MTTPSIPLPNSQAAIQDRVATARFDWHAPAFILVARLGLFSGFQALFALVFLLAAQPDPWEAAAAWWPIIAVLANAVTLGLLAWLMRREGLRLTDLYRVERHVIWREMLLLLALFLIGGPLASLPNSILGNWLFGSVELAGDMMFRPLPQWAIIVSLLFPLTITFAELPTYFAYIMPRLKALTGSTWLAVLLPALMLSAQHMALPLLGDGRFLIWRFGMFLPFALFCGIVLCWRPRLLPYMMIVHGLMYLQLVFMIPQA